MFKAIAKLCAKFALRYLPDIALYCIKTATGKTADSERAKRVLAVVQQLASDTQLVANTMKDGAVSEQEEELIKMRASVLVEEIGELL
jgi:hypothetical protein